MCTIFIYCFQKQKADVNTEIEKYKSIQTFRQLSNFCQSVMSLKYLKAGCFDDGIL